MGEYIEREALIAEFKRLTLGENSLIERIFADGVYAVLETFPAADVVEVVKCRECQHSFEDDFDGSLWCCRDYEREVVENHFCSYGERRVSDETN